MKLIITDKTPAGKREDIALRDKIRELEKDLLDGIDTIGKKWAIRMKDGGYAYQTISNYKRTLKAIVYTAIQDNCVRKNPYDFNISDILEDDTRPKEILTPEQEESLLLLQRMITYTEKFVMKLSYYLVLDFAFQSYADWLLLIWISKTD